MISASCTEDARFAIDFPRPPIKSIFFPGWLSTFYWFICMTFIVSLKYSTGMKQIFFRVCWNSRVFENLADSKTDYIFKQALDILQRERRYTMLMDLTSCDAIRGKLDEAKCPLLSASFIMKDWEERQKENTDLENLGLENTGCAKIRVNSA